MVPAAFTPKTMEALVAWHGRVMPQPMGHCQLFISLAACLVVFFQIPPPQKRVAVYTAPRQGALALSLRHKGRHEITATNRSQNGRTIFRLTFFGTVCDRRGRFNEFRTPGCNLRLQPLNCILHYIGYFGVAWVRHKTQQKGAPTSNIIL